MLIAGEASGDTLGAELATALKAEGRWEFFGAGGPRMQATGVELACDLTAHAVVGLVEVLKHYPTLRRLFQELLALARRRQPDVIVLVDYPGFNSRFAAAIRQYVRASLGPFHNWKPRIVLYVSPQLWAWHAARVRQLVRDVDLVLSIFPFEKEWYAARAPKLRVEFVGHPLLDRFGDLGRRLNSKPGNGANAAGFGGPGLPSQLPLVLLLPGSRARELKKHLPVVIAAAKKMRDKISARWRMILPHEDLVTLARRWTQGLAGLQVTTSGLAASMAEADLAIAASGTVTMECACFGVPTVVIYRTSWSTYQLGRRFIKVKHLAMPNLLGDGAIYPELIQNAATPALIAAEGFDLLTNVARRLTIRAKLAKVIASLGEPGASRRAARAVMSLFNQASPP